MSTKENLKNLMKNTRENSKNKEINLILKKMVFIRDLRKKKKLKLKNLKMSMKK
jgi:hypothetical protein